MKLTYTNVNGYLIPNFTYKSGEQMEQLGKYGFLRRDYLERIDLCLNDGKVATVSQQLLKRVVLMEKNNLKKKRKNKFGFAESQIK